jgi:hypothetical protein
MVPNPMVAGIGLNGGVVTLSLDCYARANEGQGSFSASTPVAIVQSSIVLSGRDSAITLAAAKDYFLRHLLNQSALVLWYKPESGTFESRVREALDSCQPPAAWSGARGWMLLFDGEFGSVLAG